MTRDAHDVESLLPLLLTDKQEGKEKKGGPRGREKAGWGERAGFSSQLEDKARGRLIKHSVSPKSISVPKKLIHS